MFLNKYLDRGNPLLGFGICLFLIMSVLVVFLEPFRTDESFYIYLSRLNIELPVYTAAGILFSLRSWFTLFQDFMPSLLLLRLATFLLYLASTILVFLTLKKLIPGTKNYRIDLLIISFTFTTWLALNRGFEIRTEALPNLIFLLVLFLSLSKSFLRDSLAIPVIAVLLFIPSMFSLRYWPICFATFFSVLGLRSNGCKPGKPGLISMTLMTTLFVAATVITHVVFLDLGAHLRFARSWSASNHVDLGLIEKLLFDITKSTRPSFLLLWIISGVSWLRAAVLLSSARRLRDLAMITAPAAGFYLFFLLFESKPFRYVHSVEAIALFCSTIIALKLRIALLPIHWTRHSHYFVMAVALCVALTSASELQPRYHFITNLWIPPFEIENPGDALDQIANPTNLYMQIHYREKLCSSYADRGILISEPMHHPYCGKDLGSFYNTGFATFPDSLRFAEVSGNTADILVSTILVNEMIKRNYQCTPAGKFYSLCRP